MGGFGMSSIINNLAQNSDMQSMILSMFNKINNATINAGQNVSPNGEKGISVEEFVKTLEVQLKKAVADVSENSNNITKNEQTGMPAGMKINDDNSITKDSYQEILKSIMENLDENSDGKITQEEMQHFSDKLSHAGNAETTGTLASSNVGEFLKNQAGNFIQKLIDKYKDNSESILGIFV